MGGRVLLVFKEQPSFEGELRISLIEDHGSSGHAGYSLACQKYAPWNENEWAVFVTATTGLGGEDVDEVTKSIEWQCEVPPLQATKIITILENAVASIVPQRALGFDGTFYELLIERGANRIQFAWWCEPPATWQVLGELSKMLLDIANVSSTIQAQQSDTRKRVIAQLQLELDEVQARVKNEKAELIEIHNSRCHDLALLTKVARLACPGCSVRSTDIRFIDKSPVAKSFFICGACGRSFRPEDL